MMFMACSLETFSVMPGLVPGIRVFLSSLKKKSRGWPGHLARRRASRFCPAMTQQNSLYPRHIELRLLAAAVAPQRTVLADRVGALKNPVLPRRQPREDFRFHGLGPDEAQIGFHAGKTVGREAGALLEEHPDLVIPVDIVERKGDEAELLGLLGVERLADPLSRAGQIRRVGLKARLQPRQAVAHRIGTEIHRGQFDGRRRA